MTAALWVAWAILNGRALRRRHQWRIDELRMAHWRADWFAGLAAGAQTKQFRDAWAAERDAALAEAAALEGR